MYRVEFDVFFYQFLTNQHYCKSLYLYDTKSAILVKQNLLNNHRG